MWATNSAICGALLRAEAVLVVAHVSNGEQQSCIPLSSVSISSKRQSLIALLGKDRVTSLCRLLISTSPACIKAPERSCRVHLQNGYPKWPQTIAPRLEAIASRLEAIASRFLLLVG